METVTGARILEHIKQSQLRQHPSRALTEAEWHEWAKSPEGTLEILRDPDLGRAKDYELIHLLLNKFKREPK